MAVERMKESVHRVDNFSRYAQERGGVQRMIGRKWCHNGSW